MGNGFTANVSDLSAALALALAAAERKTTIPILAFVLIEADGEKVTITGTDLDISITVSIPAVDVKPSAFCVPAKQVSSLVGLFDGVVVFELVDGKVCVRSGKSKYTLPSELKERFPEIETAKGESVSIGGEMFAGMLRSAAIAMETDPNGEEKWKAVELSAKDGKLTVAASCGRMLAFTSTPAAGEFCVLVPSRGVQSLIAFASRYDALELTCSAQHLTLRSADAVATVRLSALQFPNWRLVTQGDWAHSIELPADLIVPAIKRASLTTEERVYPPNKLTFAFSKKGIELTSQGRDRGEGFEPVAAGCPTLNGDTIRIGLFAGQILDFFRVSKPGMIMEIKDAASPVRCKPIESLGFEFEYVTMPAKPE
jgi:DNA polymerase III subunit beta